MTAELTLTRPDDMHLHLRDGAMMRAVAPHSSRVFGRAIIMPNLVPPVTTLDAALAYRDRILSAIPRQHRFEPLMTLYLTDKTRPDEVARGVEAGVITAVKLYPAGATTNSDKGVTDIARVMPVLETMARIGTPLLVHGEVTLSEIDIFDREAAFIDRVLAPLRQRLPDLRIVMEHVTTREGVEFVKSSDRGLAATLTVHHLILNRNAMLAGGIRPHYYCLPVLKREAHRVALREAATSGDPRFFLGTDSAPHSRGAKECACGCAGLFTAPNAMPVLASIFEADGKLDLLEGFSALNGARFYGLPPNPDKIRLVRTDQPQSFAPEITVGDEAVVVFDPGFPVHWRVASGPQSQEGTP